MTELAQWALGLFSEKAGSCFGKSFIYKFFFFFGLVGNKNSQFSTFIQKLAKVNKNFWDIFKERDCLLDDKCLKKGALSVLSMHSLEESFFHHSQLIVLDCLLFHAPETPAHWNNA